MRILIVDDNPDVASVIAELLTIEGFEDVRIAYDGASALALMRAAPPDFMLCDLGLPGAIDGHELARISRREPALRNVRLVAISGYAGHEDRETAIAAGFEELLAKPVRIDALTACIRRGGR